MGVNFVIAACLAAMPLWAADDAAVIVDSGSTNTAGVRIVVERSGKAGYTRVPRRSGEQPGAKAKSKSGTVPKELVRRFYADLEAAKPLSELPREGCMKSASFGTTLTIEFGGQATPDLSCGDHGDSRLKALIQDAFDIEKIFDGK